MKKKNATKYIRITVILIGIYMIFSISREAIRTVHLYYSINQASQESDRLKEETTRLNNEVLRLKDDDYIQSFVSGTIFQTREGTSVYILPERNNGE